MAEPENNLQVSSSMNETNNKHKQKNKKKHAKKRPRDIVEQENVNNTHNNVESSKKKKKKKKKDRISDLSDKILLHILSFLPTNEAFITTFLSKRWNELCYSLTTLCFDDQNIPKNTDAKKRFYLIIDKLILSPRVANQSLKTLQLKCSRTCRRQSLDAWVEAAKRRRIQELDLFFINTVTLNPTIFTSNTLVILKLRLVQVVVKNLCVDLPSLKTLELKHVYFEFQNDIKKLLNGSPNLQDLHTSYPIYIRREDNKLKSLILSKLVRADINSTDVPFDAISNVEFLRLLRAQDPISHKKKMDDFFKRIPVFHNLIHVELCFSGFFHGWDGVVDFLRHCPKLQILHMSKWDTSLSKDWDCPISSLECVSSHLRSCTILHFGGSENDLRFATYILQNARCLEVMTIDVTARSSNGMQKAQILEEVSTCPRMSPGCKLSLQFH